MDIFEIFVIFSILSSMALSLNNRIKTAFQLKANQATRNEDIKGLLILSIAASLEVLSISLILFINRVLLKSQNFQNSGALVRPLLLFVMNARMDFAKNRIPFRCTHLNYRCR